MQTKVNQAAVQGYETTGSLSSSRKANRSSTFRPKRSSPCRSDNQMTVRVQFTRPISFPGYTYNYEFDYTAKSTSF